VTAPTESSHPAASAPAGDPGFLAGAQPLDLSRTAFPPPLRSSARRTILDITKYFGDTTGGIRTYLLAKAAYVQARAGLRQVLVIPGAHDGLGEQGGVRCYRLRGPRIPFDQSYRFLLATRTTRRILEHERPDLIEVGSPWLVPWVTRRANRSLHAPMVWFYHTHFPAIIAPGLPGVPGWRRAAAGASWRYVRRMSRLFRGVLVASESVARQLEEQGVANVQRVALGVDLERFTPARRDHRGDTLRQHRLPDAPLALYLGRFAEEKQLETVLAAWRTVGPRTGAWLVLVGAGPREARLRARAEGLQVRWLPYQRNRDTVADLLAAADLYLAPGPAETFGLSALEGMASGTPVLSVDTGGVADRVRASGLGALYPAGDVRAAAEAACALLEAPPGPLRQAARAFVEREHSWDRAFDGIFASYDQLLGSGR
jgi:alpha-1,6-mannosyltransferase